MALDDKKDEIIKKYNDGQSMTSIAKQYDTYPATIRKFLMKNGVELRHDSNQKGYLTVKDGEKLIEWAKAQGRLVTKVELAKVIGKSRLSPSYFIKYPELGKYVDPKINKEIESYGNQLYKWLNENNISYKPKDRKTLKDVVLDAILLEDYANIALQISVKPVHTSKCRHNDNMKRKFEKAKEAGITLIFLDETDFSKNLDSLKETLLLLKKK